MSDTTMTIIAIFLAAILMFIFPLMTMADRTDDVVQLSVQTATTDFVDDIRKTAKITQNNYDKLVETLAATGNSYEVEIEVQILDENPAKKSTQAKDTVIGQNVYYTVYTTQILDELREKYNKNNKINEAVKNLKEGDIVSVKVKNTNTTLSQQLKNAFYKITGNDSYVIAAEHAGIVTTTSSN